MALVLIAGAAASPFVEDSPCSKLTAGCESLHRERGLRLVRRLAHDQGRREGSGLPHAAIQNASSGWHCAGQLASAGSKFQCECDLPLLDDPVLNSKSGATVETTWRGFSIAPTGKWPAIAGELSFDFSNVGTQGKASISAGNVTVTHNVPHQRSQLEALPHERAAVRARGRRQPVVFVRDELPGWRRLQLHGDRLQHQQLDAYPRRPQEL